MCIYEPDETWTTWNEKIVLPKPPVECDGCGRLISPHETFYSMAILFDSKWSRERACFECWWTMKEFGDAHNIITSPDQIWQLLQDCIGENDDDDDVWRDHLAALKKRFRMSPAGRRSAARKREERRIRRGRTSWSLRAGDSPPFPMPDDMRSRWFK